MGESFKLVINILFSVSEILFVMTFRTSAVGLEKESMVFVVREWGVHVEVINNFLDYTLKCRL